MTESTAQRYVTVVSAMSAMSLVLIMIAGWIVNTIVVDQQSVRAHVHDLESRVSVLEVRVGDTGTVSTGNDN